MVPTISRTSKSSSREVLSCQSLSIEDYLIVIVFLVVDKAFYLLGIWHPIWSNIENDVCFLPSLTSSLFLSLSLFLLRLPSSLQVEYRKQRTENFFVYLVVSGKFLVHNFLIDFFVCFIPSDSVSIFYLVMEATSLFYVSFYREMLLSC